MPEGERRLAAIMFTDIVGYTSLTEKNEPVALKLLEDHRRLLRPFFPRHGGKEIKTMGDAFLVEFGSALEAVRCAILIQKEISRGNMERGRENEIRLRIGIHVGDVEHKQEDVLGEAVNIASRIEAFAEPGGIVVSRQVYDQIRNRSDIRTRSLGIQELKNVRETLEIFSVSPLEDTTLQSSRVSRTRVAVLPFSNISPEASDEYFADGMTEEMISTLSNVSNLTVISRTSVMQYKGARKNLADIGRELKAGTMLEGSVRKIGNRVRITVQLLDAMEDKHLWSQSYDRELRDVFAVQSDIATSVTDALKVKLLAKEASQIQKKPTESMDAYLLYLNGRQQWNKRSEEAVMKAIEYFTQAIDQDPNFALAYVGLADCYAVLYDKDTMTSAEADEKGRRAVLKALELDETLAEAHATYANFLTHGWSWDAAEAEFKKAIGINTNYATGHQWYSFMLTTEGRLEEALVEAKNGLELDPLAPVMSFNVARVFFALERYDDAIEYAKRSLAIDPNFPYGLFGMMVGYDWKGEFDQALIWWERLYGNNARRTPRMFDLAIIQARAGKRDEALKSFDSGMRMKGLGSVSAFHTALVYAALNDEERALQSLERAVAEHEADVAGTIKWNPMFKDLRSSPRFLEILKKLGLDKF